MKAMLITFLNIIAIVQFEFISQGPTVNKVYCVKIIEAVV